MNRKKIIIGVSSVILGVAFVAPWPWLPSIKELQVSTIVFLIGSILSWIVIPIWTYDNLLAATQAWYWDLTRIIIFTILWLFVVYLLSYLIWSVKPYSPLLGMNFIDILGTAIVDGGFFGIVNGSIVLLRKKKPKKIT